MDTWVLWTWQDDGDGAAAKKKKAKQPRRLTGKCWMAEDFPMTLHQLLPVLEVGPSVQMHSAR